MSLTEAERDHLSLELLEVFASYRKHPEDRYYAGLFDGFTQVLNALGYEARDGGVARIDNIHGSGCGCVLPSSLHRDGGGGLQVSPHKQGIPENLHIQEDAGPMQIQG